MNRTVELPLSSRRAFGELMRSARGLMTHEEAAEAAGRLLETDGPSRRFVQHLETGPPRPLANVAWLDALLRAYGLGWHILHDVLGCSAPRWLPLEVSREVEAVVCPCGATAQRVECNAADIARHGCGRDRIGDECCARAFVCGGCGSRLTGKASAPEMEDA